MLKFLKKGPNFKVMITTSKNLVPIELGLVIRNTHMKSLSLAIQKIWPMLKFLAPSSTVNYKHVVIVNGGGQHARKFREVH
jgi:hypothetical protein